ncbi:hypothetical protein AAU61_18895 [Desulfocarbo indianensis]|nr:hypothetical protein AAU61_18895 [Desulfocarbo indianensis]
MGLGGACLPLRDHQPMSYRSMRLALLAAFFCLALAMPAQAQDKVRLQLHWVHQAQFAGFYLAQDAGIYREAGLEVDIVPGGPGIDSLQNLAQGKCHFATGWLSGAMEYRDQGFPLVLMAQLIQRSALLLITFKDHDIDSIKELDGQRVGLWGGHFNIQPRALFKGAGIAVKEIPQNVSMAPLLEQAVSAASGMYYNEYHQLYQAGVDYDELRVFEFSKLGLNFPEDGIYGLESLRRQNPDLCGRFIAASLAGWRLTFEQPDRALEAVMKRVDAAQLASNAGHQRWMLNATQELITHRVGRQGLGQLSPRDFSLVNRVLVDQGLLRKPVALASFYQPPPEKRP